MQFVTLIFAFLTIFGAFVAWRNSPLYSIKIALKLIGTFLLMVALVVLLTWAIFHGPVSRSPIAKGIFGFLSVLIVSTGASAFIVHITDAHVAQLPNETKLVTFNRHKVYRWLWRLAAFLLVCGAAALVLPAAWQLLPIGVAGFVLILCGPTLSIFLMMARRNDRGMTSVIANPWAHWQYTTEQWTAWAETQRTWEEAQSASWSTKGMLGFVGLCGGLFALGGLFSGDSLREMLPIVGGLTGGVVALTALAYWFNRTNFERRYRRLVKAAPETWLGDEGIFCNGSYTPWILSGKYLLKATAATGPPACVTLIFQTYNGSQSRLVAERVLIAEGHLGDLAGVQQKLDAQCPRASVHLVL